MSEQDNSSSSDLIGLTIFSLLDDDFDLDLIPTQKLFFSKKTRTVCSSIWKRFTQMRAKLRKPEKIINGQ